MSNHLGACDRSDPWGWPAGLSRLICTNSTSPDVCYLKGQIVFSSGPLARRLAESSNRKSLSQSQLSLATVRSSRYFADSGVLMHSHSDQMSDWYSLDSTSVSSPRQNERTVRKPLHFWTCIKSWNRVVIVLWVTTIKMSTTLKLLYSSVGDTVARNAKGSKGRSEGENYWGCDRTLDGQNWSSKTWEIC